MRVYLIFYILHLQSTKCKTFVKWSNFLLNNVKSTEFTLFSVLDFICPVKKNRDGGMKRPKEEQKKKKIKNYQCGLSVGLSLVWNISAANLNGTYLFVGVFFPQEQHFCKYPRTTLVYVQFTKLLAAILIMMGAKEGVR